MTKSQLPIHPEDVLLFERVSRAMWNVAKDYQLGLKSIEAFPIPKSGMANRMGDCNADGSIRIVMRCTVDGAWCDAPLSPDEIWDTAAHELAHLRHLNHGANFQEFHLEMRMALKNQQQDYRQKILKRLVQYQQNRDSEMKAGNEGAADAFAGMINRMMIQYELSPSELDYARTKEQDPIIEIGVDLSRYRIEEKKTRIAWQESLARIVANANLCMFLIHRDSNKIWFVGTNAHASVAEYTYGILVSSAAKMAKTETYQYKLKCTRERQAWRAKGYGVAWLNAFVDRVRVRLEEARREAMAFAVHGAPGSESQALIRLDGALIRAKKYVEDKFANNPKKSLRALRNRHGWHPVGVTDGTAAADRMPIGRKGLTEPTEPKALLGDETED